MLMASVVEVEIYNFKAKKKKSKSKLFRMRLLTSQLFFLFCGLYLHVIILVPDHRVGII